MKTHNNFDEQFEFAGNAKTWSLAAIAIGVIVVALGFITGEVERTFANLLLMGYYVTCVCLAGAFFCAIQYVTQAGWSASILRVPHALIKVLPIAATILVVIIIAGLTLTHTIKNEEGHEVVAPYLYKIWGQHGIVEEDAIIAGKSGYLNLGFFLARVIGFLLAYILLSRLFVKYSTNEDELSGMSNYDKSFKLACVFLVIFGFTIPVFAFDVIRGTLVLNHVWLV
jgi:hypothetical protein